MSLSHTYRIETPNKIKLNQLFVQSLWGTIPLILLCVVFNENKILRQVLRNESAQERMRQKISC